MFSSWIAIARAVLSKTVRNLADRSLLPETPFNSDLYLVEFPKSGVTWLSFLIANANAMLANEQHVVTFFNINDFVPDIHVGRLLTPPPATPPGFRCIKSHAAYTPSYRKIIYLVRDPRNVIASYYNFLAELGLWTGTIEDLADHPEYGIKGWTSHVNGWLDGVDAGASFTLLRYEDLLGATAIELQRIYQLLGWPLADETARVVVDRCSAERMRVDEALFNLGHPRLRNFTFVGANAGSTRVAITDSLRAHIEEVAGETMQRLGYAI